MGPARELCYVLYWMVSVRKKGTMKLDTYPNNFPNSAGISPSRSSQQTSCTLQMLFCLRGLQGQLKACCSCCLQSGSESCPIRTKTRRSDCQNPVCSHPTFGRNPLNRPVVFEKQSDLRRLFSDQRRLQIRPNHQDRFCRLH